MKTFTIDINGWHSECKAPTRGDAMHIFRHRAKNSVEVEMWIRQMLAKQIKVKK